MDYLIIFGIPILAIVVGIVILRKNKIKAGQKINLWRILGIILVTLGILTLIAIQQIDSAFKHVKIPFGAGWNELRDTNYD